MKPVSDTLDSAIIALAKSLPYHGEASAPNSWKALQAWAKNHTVGVDSLPVFNGGGENTIYGSQGVNIAQRALHDSHHIGIVRGFDLASEIAVAESQADQLRAFGCSQTDCELLVADIVAQAEHWGRHRRYVVDQRSFVLAWLSNPSTALNKVW